MDNLLLFACVLCTPNFSASYLKVSEKVQKLNFSRQKIWKWGEITNFRESTQWLHTATVSEWKRHERFFFTAIRKENDSGTFAIPSLVFFLGLAWCWTILEDDCVWVVFDLDIEDGIHKMSF